MTDQKQPLGVPHVHSQPPEYPKHGQIWVELLGGGERFRWWWDSEIQAWRELVTDENPEQSA